MLHVVARRSLARFVPVDAQRRLLLEGSWSDDDADTRRCACVALDDVFDAQYAWIDAEASRLADRIVGQDVACRGDESSFFAVNALRLRYAVVKWLRCLVWQSRQSTPLAQLIALHASTSPVDDEYVALWTAIATAQGRQISVHRHHDDVDSSPTRHPPNAAWRRMLARCLCRTVARRPSSGSPRVLLCGNPRILEPICEELLRRNILTAWLFDRFAVRPWLQWGTRGVRMLTCDETSPPSPVLFGTTVGESLLLDNVDLSTVVEAWRNRLEPELGQAQDRQRRQVTRHIADLQLTHVIVDEDATPLPRIVVAAARRHRVPSSVVQHGACGIRFGFAPLHADQILVSDDGSRRQLLDWDVPPERVVFTGSPHQDKFVAAVCSVKRPVRDTPYRQILLLGTTPPRDERPDAVTYRLTGRSYEQMLTNAFAAVAELGDAMLVVRPHPRADRDPFFEQVHRRFPLLPVRMTARREQLADLVAAADCILSCASSAGIDAALAGRPVVQLLPAGSGPILPAAWYGLLGEARTLEELRPLLARALSPSRSKASNDDVVESASAAMRIVDEVLTPAPNVSTAALERLDVREAAHA